MSEPILPTCPTCHGPWNVSDELRALQLRVDAAILPALTIMLYAWTSDYPEWQQWGEAALRGYAEIIRRTDEN